MTTDYREIGSELGELLNSKQRAYGNVFSATPAILGLLFPSGMPVLAYRDVLTIVRILDKIGRICTAAGKGDPMGEDPWRDIAGYAMLALGQREEQQQKDELDTEAYLNDPGPEPSGTVADEAPEEKATSNEWAVVWASEKYGPYIEAVFPTRELAEARRREMAGAQPSLTWRVCRVDEVGK